MGEKINVFFSQMQFTCVTFTGRTNHASGSDVIEGGGGGGLYLTILYYQQFLVVLISRINILNSV